MVGMFDVCVEFRTESGIGGFDGEKRMRDELGRMW